MACMLLLALGVRLPGIARPAIGDEDMSVATIEQPLSEMAGSLVQRDAHPPLYFWLLRAWGSVSRELWWLRLLSVGFGAAACGLVVRIGRRCFTERLGWYAGALAAMSPLLIFVSQYLRPYAMAVCLSCAAVLVMGRLLCASGPVGVRHLAPLAMLMIALLYTSYASAFIVVALGAFLLAWPWAPLRRRLLLGAGVSGVVALAWLPWLPSYAAQMARVYDGASSSTPLLKEAGVGFYLGSIQVGAMAKAFLALLQVNELQMLMTRFSARYSAGAFWLATGAAGALIAALTVAGTRVLRASQRARGLSWLVLLVALLPPVGAAARSAAGDVGLLPPLAVNVRYLGESAACFTLVLAGAVLGLAAAGRAAAIGLAVLLSLAQASSLYAYPFNHQRQILRVLDADSAATLVVSFPISLDGFVDAPRRERLRGRYQQITLTPDGWQQGVARITAHQRFRFVQVTTAEWMIHYEPIVRAVEAALARHGYVQVGEQVISDTLRVATYERRS